MVSKARSVTTTDKSNVMSSTIRKTKMRRMTLKVSKTLLKVKKALLKMVSSTSSKTRSDRHKTLPRLLSTVSLGLMRKRNSRKR